MWIAVLVRVHVINTLVLVMSSVTLMDVPVIINVTHTPPVHVIIRLMGIPPAHVMQPVMDIQPVHVMLHAILSHVRAMQSAI